MRVAFWFGVGILLGALLRGPSATAQQPGRLYGTSSGAPIPLQATSAGYLRVWAN